MKYFIYLHACVLYVHTLLINNLLKVNHRVINYITQHIWRNEEDIVYDASFQVRFVSYTSLLNKIFKKIPQPEITRFHIW